MCDAAAELSPKYQFSIIRICKPYYWISPLSLFVIDKGAIILALHFLVLIDGCIIDFQCQKLQERMFDDIWMNKTTYPKFALITIVGF